MRNLRIHFFYLVIALITSSCNAPSTSLFTPPPTPLPASTIATTEIVLTMTAAPTIALLSTEILKNSEYYLPQYNQTIKLVNGRYEAGSGANYILATLLAPVAWGDLNEDGIEDAAVLVAENAGGSGVFVSLMVMLNQGGQPVQANSVLIDDRPQVNTLTIQNNQIVVEALIHSPNDAMCCPTFPVTETYKWLQSQLRLVHFTSQTPIGTTRIIDIESPAPGTEVSGSVQIKGSVSISPFENTLGYRLYNTQGNVLVEGPVQVISEEMGGPGTFDTILDVSGIPTGTIIYLELLDLSAADGSILAMDSVEMMVK